MGIRSRQGDGFRALRRASKTHLRRLSSRAAEEGETRNRLRIVPREGRCPRGRIRPPVPTMSHQHQLLGRKHPLMSRVRAIVAALLLALLPHALDAAQIGPSKFDHLTTGYELMAAHLIVPCESCHVGAIFKGTPRECVSCHSQGARITATYKGQDHVLSSARC